MPFIWETRHKASAFYHGWKKSIQKTLYGSCAVLLYHRVTNYLTDPQLLCVRPGHFDSHLDILKNEFHVLNIAEWREHILRQEKFPPRSVVITFDDGYADNYLEALPLLQKHNLQALFYICTGNIGTDREFWWDEAERLILLSEWQGQQVRIRIDDTEFGFSEEEASRKKCYEEILPVLRKKTPAQRKEILSALAAQTGNPPPRATHRSMTWEEVVKMSDSLSAVIGAHTHNHVSLAALDPDEQIHEIQQSKILLEGNTGREVRNFSYPFGTKLDYTNRTIRICRDLGFRVIASNFPYIAHAHTDPFQVPRFLVRDWDANRFRSEVNQFLN